MSSKFSIIELAKNILRPVYYRIPDEIRFGKIYREQLNFLLGSRKWSREEVDRWQLKKIQHIVRAAYNETIYYKDLLDSIGMNPDDLRTISDFKKIPLLTKELIQNNLEKIVSRKYKKKQLHYITTGGSTGIPLGLYYVKGYSKSIEWAFVHNIWKRFGFKTNKRHAILRGSIVKNGLVEKKGLELIVSSYHMIEDNLSIYIKAINKFKPEFIQAYPSSISILCQFMKENFIPPFESVKMLMCSSENLYDFQRELIDHVLGVPICNHYGNTEHTFIASNCISSDNLHFYPEYGYVEVLNDNGAECEIENESGEIISTNFTNPAFPIIRYRSQDIATFTNERCKCQWNYKLVKDIQGREQEFVITNTGRKICIAAINMHSDIFDHVSQFQLFQNSPGQVIFNYIPKKDFAKSNETKIYSELIQKFGNDIQLHLKNVKHINRTQRGKHKFLIQKLDVNSYH